MFGNHIHSPGFVGGKCQVPTEGDEVFIEKTADGVCAKSLSTKYVGQYGTIVVEIHGKQFSLELEIKKK